jgi:uncharacterized membrane protein YoaK (UPF0700 family)
LEQPKINQSLVLRDTLVVVLAFTSGFVDALTFLRLGVFASVLTGNTVLVALAIGSGDFLHAVTLLVAILGYISGVAIGARIANPTPLPQKIWPRAITKALVVEFLVLLLLAIGGFFASAKPSGPFLYTPVALAALAMAIQSAAVHSLGLPDISTTYITGTYTTFISRLVGPRSSKSLKNTESGTVGKRLYVYVIVMYVLAAIAGCMAESHWLLEALIIPVITIGFVISVARIRMY